MTIRPLTNRERKCLEALVCVHQEFGLFSQITSDALTGLTDEPWTASLSALVMLGLAERVSTPDGIGYRMTEAGWAQFAGVEVEA